MLFLSVLLSPSVHLSTAKPAPGSAYTEATLGHHGEDALKGRDRAIVVLLQSVSEGLPEDQQLEQG